MTTLPLTFARFFRKIPHPIPQTFATPTPYDELLERYSLLQAHKCSNQTPLIHLFPVQTYPLPDLIQQLDATLFIAYNRPYRHVLYSADNNIQHLQPLPFTLIRQWVSQPSDRKLSVVTFLEPADHPLNKEWGNYWAAINDRHSTPPAHFWEETPPLMLTQDTRGIIQWPSKMA